MGWLSAPLPPVPRSGPYLGGALGLQLVGLALPAIDEASIAEHAGVTGVLARMSYRLGWDQLAHSRLGVGLLVVAVILYVAGAIIMARPFARHRAMQVLLAPVVALVGAMVLGVFVLLVAAAVAVLEGSPDDLIDSFWPGPGTGRSGRTGARYRPRESSRRRRPKRSVWTALRKWRRG